MRIIRQILFLCLLFGNLHLIAKSPCEVKVGFYLVNLSDLNIANGTFYADFYLTFYYPSNCDPQHFEFANGRAEHINLVIDEPGKKQYRIQAKLRAPIDLQDFPFNKETIRIRFEDALKSVDELRYVPLAKETAINDNLIFPGWQINKWEVIVENHAYAVWGSTYSQYEFVVHISRVILNSFIKTFLPIFFILLIVLFSFIIDPKKLAVRLSMIGSVLIAAVMFHVAILNQIPPLGYLTLADKVMVATYFIIIISFLLTIILFDLQQQGKNEMTEKIYRYTKYWMPLALIIIFTTTLILLAKSVMS